MILLRTAFRRHDAQQCYCGEANCVGVLGGKTQTDVAAMDDLYLDGTCWGGRCLGGYMLITC